MALVRSQASGGRIYAHVQATVWSRVIDAERNKLGSSGDGMGTLEPITLCWAHGHRSHFIIIGLIIVIALIVAAKKRKSK